MIFSCTNLFLARATYASSIFCWHFLIPPFIQWRIDSDESLNLIQTTVLRFNPRSRDSLANQILNGASERRENERTIKKNLTEWSKKKICKYKIYWCKSFCMHNCFAPCTNYIEHSFDNIKFISRCVNKNKFLFSLNLVHTFLRQIKYYNIFK